MSALRVLIADDDPIARRFLESAVSRAGYEVTAVSDGDEAWRVLSGPDAPPVAVLDWMMPGHTGIEVCEKVRAAGLRIPPYLIVLTSRGATDDVVRALRAGADDHITKPFEVDELRARLAVGARIVTLQRQLADRVRALEEALAHVQQLQGLIPICAWCRQARRRRLLGAGGELSGQALRAAVLPRHLRRVPGAGAEGGPGVELPLAGRRFSRPGDRVTVPRVAGGR
jgi:DNA-binding response OmpR family regulator